MTSMLAALPIVGAAVLLPFFVYLFMSLSAAAARVYRGGRSEAREFQRAGFGLRPFLSARMRRQDSGSLVSTRAGVRLSSSSRGLRVGETRTIAKDVF